MKKRACPHCGSRNQTRARGLQGFGEVGLCLLLCLLLLLPGIAYYLWVESRPICDDCGRRC